MVTTEKNFVKKKRHGNYRNYKRWINVSSLINILKHEKEVIKVLILKKNNIHNLKVMWLSNLLNRFQPKIYYTSLRSRKNFVKKKRHGNQWKVKRWNNVNSESSINILITWHKGNSKDLKKVVSELNPIYAEAVDKWFRIKIYLLGIVMGSPFIIVCVLAPDSQENSSSSTTSNNCTCDFSTA